MTAGASSAWAAGYTRTLTESLEVAGYKAKAFYDFQNNNPEVLPTSGDLRYRAYEKGGYWGLHNFGGGSRSGSATIPVAASDILVLQHYSSDVVATINCGALNSTLTSSVGYQVYDITTDAESITFSIGRGGGIIAAFVMEKDASTETVDYTINYVFGDETVKTVSGNSAVGTTINADDVVWNADNTQKYFAADDATTSIELSSSASDNVLTVELREASTVSYSINAVSGETTLFEIASGSVFEGESASYGYPQYYAKDGVLYKSSKYNTNPWWGGNFVPTAENGNLNISYSVEIESGVVFCEEGENIESLTPVTGGNTDIRASNRAGGYAASNAVITTLPAGTYKLCAATYGNAGTTFSFNAGGVTVMEITTSGNPVHTESEEFTLKGTVDIIVPQAGNAGNSPKTIDYIYIVKTGDVEETAEIIPVTTDAGYTTYVAKNAIEIPSNIEAYTVCAENNESVALSPVESVPAGTPIIVKAAKGNYDCNIVPSAEEPAFKFLKASDGSVVGDGTIYAMAKKNDVVGFYPVAEGVTVPAGKAYIVVEGEAPVKGYLALGDEADAINNIAVEAANGAIYNIAGQKMESIKNGGLYIVNGKKVVVK